MTRIEVAAVDQCPVAFFPALGTRSAAAPMGPTYWTPVLGYRLEQDGLALGSYPVPEWRVSSAWGLLPVRQ